MKKSTQLSFLGSIFIITLIMGGGCAEGLNTSGTSPISESPSPSMIHPDISAVKSEVSVKNWKSFSNKQLGIEFLYPDSMNVSRVEDMEPQAYAYRVTRNDLKGCNDEYIITFQSGIASNGPPDQTYSDTLKPETATPVAMLDQVSTDFAYWQYTGQKVSVQVTGKARESCLDGRDRARMLAETFRAFLGELRIQPGIWDQTSVDPAEKYVYNKSHWVMQQQWGKALKYLVPDMLVKGQEGLIDGVKFAVKIDEVSALTQTDDALKAQVKDDVRYIESGGVVPKAASGASRVTRYEAYNLKGYYLFRCSEQERALYSVFTTYAENERYQFEMTDTRPEWKQLQSNEFYSGCQSSIAGIFNGRADQQAKDIYRIREKMVESIKF